jgi:hypothetical protein
VFRITWLLHLFSVRVSYYGEPEIQIRILGFRAFKDRGEHDEFPKETAIGTIVFNIICDIGAYRDLQRHRKGTQIIEQWSTLRGYEIPEVLELDIHKELKEKYVGVYNPNEM